MKRIAGTVLAALSLLTAVPAAADDPRTVSIQVLKAAQHPLKFTGRTLAVYAMQYVTDSTAAGYTFRNDTLPVREAALGIKSTLEEWEALSDYDTPVYDYYAHCPAAGDTCRPNEELLGDYHLSILVRDVSVQPFQKAVRQSVYDPWQFDTYYIYSVTTEAPCTATMEVYDADTRQFLFRQTLSDTLVWEQEASTIESGLKALPDTIEAVALAAAELGKRYARQLVPYWTSVQRFFFVPSVRELRQAANYAEASKWAEAMQVWERYAGSANRRTAGQSAFNMALGCELTGRYELALEWLHYAEKTYPGLQEAAGYRALLQRRISESETIERQLQDL